MRHISKLYYVVGVSSLCFSPAIYAADIIGINSAVKGDVTIQTGENEVRKAVVKDEIRLQDAVNSSKSSTLQITLKDQTTFTVGPNCDLVIDTFIYDPNKANNTLTATVSKGMFRFMSGSISKSNPDAVTINSPVASMGIRGTIVEGVVGSEAVAIAAALNIIPANVTLDNAGASFFVLRGPGVNNLGNDSVGRITVTNAGGTVDVTQAGQAVFVPNPLTAPILVDSITFGNFQSFSAQLRTVPNAGPDTMAFNVSPNIPTVGLASASGTSASTTAIGLAGIALGGAALVAITGGSEEQDTAVSN